MDLKEVKVAMETQKYRNFIGFLKKYLSCIRWQHFVVTESSLNKHFDSEYLQKNTISISISLKFIYQRSIISISFHNKIDIHILGLLRINISF